MRTPLRKDEKVLFETRRHWFVILIPIVITITMIVLSIILFIKMPEFNYWYLLFPLFAILYFSYRYYSWKFDIWVITNFRVIDEAGVLSITSKESPIDKINNISYQQSLIGRMFGYGNVQIQTAAEMGETSYANIARPQKLKESLSSAQEMYKDMQLNKQAYKLADAVDGEIGEVMKECPFCAEKIKAKAIVCRYCGKDLKN